MNQPQFSIICCYNDKKILGEFLEAGLDEQTTGDFERVFVDNRDMKHASAPAALHEGAKQASGEYYLFAHQDTRLPPEYLEKAGGYLDAEDRVGIAGAVGARPGENTAVEDINVIEVGDDRRLREDAIAIDEPADVHSLDELLFIIPADVYTAHPLSDLACGGWFLYGAEYCMLARQNGLRAITLPLPVWHKDGGLERDWRNYLALLKISHRYPEYDRVYAPQQEWPATRRYALYMLVEKLSPPYPQKFLRIAREDGVREASAEFASFLVR